MIPVLILPYRDYNHEDKTLVELENDLDADYVMAFIPEYGPFIGSAALVMYCNSFVLPLSRLWPDQIELLKSRGAFEGDADIIMGTSYLDRDVDGLKWDDEDLWDGRNVGSYISIFALRRTQWEETLTMYRVRPRPRPREC